MSNPLHSPAAERNRQPILEVLRTLLPATGRALEVARVVFHSDWYFQSPEKGCTARRTARWQWPRPCQALQRRRGPFFGAPSGRVTKGPSALLQALDVTRYACAPAPSSRPLGHSLKVPIRVKHYTCGTGQHVAWFAAALPGWTWQPSDAQAEHFDSIRAWCADAAAHNVHPPVVLDVLAPQWPASAPAFATPFDLVYCANMLHIAPWACCAGLMQGAARHLAPGGHLVTYGPYLEDGVPTAPGNRDFDASLRERNPAWGIRRLQDVAQVAAAAGLHLVARHALPANNLLLAWARRPSTP